MELVEIVHNRVKGFKNQLAESQTWKPFLEGLTDKRVKGDTALMLENTRQYFEGLDETTRAINIGDFEKFASN
jgi:hypothetical protein